MATPSPATTSNWHCLVIEPLPCPRPRIATRGKFAHAYYPASYAKWKTACAELIGELKLPTLAGRLSLSALFCCTKPRTSKLSGPKPDIDNYLKSLMDALTAAKAWEDDCQVVEVYAQKQWDKSGYIRINIEEINA